MTLQQWNNLPLLLTRAQFLAVTGLSSTDLSALVRSGRVVPVLMEASPARTGTKRKARYRKQCAAALAGLQV